MTTFHRIFHYVRAEVAQFSRASYFTAVGMTLGFLGFGYFTHLAEGSDAVSDFDRILTTSGTGLVVISALVIWFSSLIFASQINDRQFKEEANAEQVLSLPLSSGERFAAQLILLLLVVPLVCSVLCLLTYSLIYLLPVPAVLLPTPARLLAAVPFGWLAHLITTSLWLSPYYALGKKVWWVIGAVVLLLGAYTKQTYDTYDQSVYVAFDDRATRQPGVVDAAALSYRNRDAEGRKTTERTPQLRIETFERGPGLVSLYVVFALLFYLCAYLALTRNTA